MSLRKSCSWLNAVENFFSKLTRQRLQQGVFRSIADLQAAIDRYVAATNDDPKPFVWTKDANGILKRVTRANQALASEHQLSLFRGGSNRQRACGCDRRRASRGEACSFDKGSRDKPANAPTLLMEQHPYPGLGCFKEIQTIFKCARFFTIKSMT